MQHHPISTFFLYMLFQTIFCLGGSGQKLSVEEMKNMHEMSSDKINSFLLKKGYKLMKHWDSDTTWDRGSVYGYRLEDNNVQKAEKAGRRLVLVQYFRDAGKWIPSIGYNTPDSTETLNVEAYCKSNGFEQTWAPSFDNEEVKSYERKVGKEFSIVGFKKEPPLPGRKSYFRIFYQSTKIE